jgi:hypothetical protein
MPLTSGAPQFLGNFCEHVQRLGHLIPVETLAGAHLFGGTAEGDGGEEENGVGLREGSTGDPTRPPRSRTFLT